MVFSRGIKKLMFPLVLIGASRKDQALSPYWSLSQGPSSRSGNSVKPAGLPHMQVGMISLDYKPLVYNCGACKHRVTRDMHTSLNTKSKPRAKYYYAGLTSLSTS